MADDDSSQIVTRLDVRHVRRARDGEERARRAGAFFIQVRAAILALAVEGIDVEADAVAEALVDVDARRVAPEPAHSLNRALLSQVAKAREHAGVVDLSAHVDIRARERRRGHELTHGVTDDRITIR